MPRKPVRTVGSVALEGDDFKVSARPHVRMMMKRLFGRSRGLHGDLAFRISDESCRDLHWFTRRYPLEFSSEARKRMLRGKREYEKRTEAAARILAGQYEASDKFEEMALPPRPYQEKAAMLCLTTKTLLVVDELGLGKTVTGIAMLRERKTLPALVVAPPHLCEQWKDQLAKFMPQYSVEVVKTVKYYDLDPWPDVIVCSYYRLHGWADHLADRIETVIFDEVQELRIPTSQKYQASKYVGQNATYTMGLSATPIYGYGGEIFWVYNAMCEGLLGSWEEFKREWCREMYGDRNKAQLLEPDAFGEYVRDQGWMVRRTRADVGRELPPLSRVTQTVSSDTKVLEAARTSALALAKVIVSQNASSEDRFHAAGQLDMKMRHATGVAKAPFVAAFADMLLESSPDEPLVMFGWHRDVYGIWAEALKKYNPVWHTGRESGAQKRKSLKAFTSGDSRLMFMSLRSGSGVDGLQHVCCRYVIGELDWSPGVLEQCGGRLDRDGQTKPVFGYFPVCENGSDPLMVDLLGLKRAQVEGLRDPGGPALKVRQVDPGHIRKLAEELLKGAKR